MATKKTSADDNVVELKAPEVTEEEVRDHELEQEDLLAGMPELRAPGRLRIRHKNRLKAIGIRHGKHLQALSAAQENDTDIPEEAAIGLLDLAAEVEEFGESIAIDPAAYEEWAIKHADDVAVFVALLNRYMGAVGE